ncbi:MAG: carbonic anhydrase [Acidobacteriota bacterium]
MAAATIFESTVPWNPTRPDTVIISCVDGRWRAQIQEFAATYLKADLHADFLAVPGGIEPLTLIDLVPKDFNFFRRRLESLVQAHGTKRIVAIGHQDCAWYKQRRLLSLTIDLRERQITDLKRVAARLRGMLPDITVETYYARLDDRDPGRVVFEQV